MLQKQSNVKKILNVYHKYSKKIMAKTYID